MSWMPPVRLELPSSSHAASSPRRSSRAGTPASNPWPFGRFSGGRRRGFVRAAAAAEEVAEEAGVGGLGDGGASGAAAVEELPRARLGPDVVHRHDLHQLLPLLPPSSSRAATHLAAEAGALDAAGALAAGPAGAEGDAALAVRCKASFAPRTPGQSGRGLRVQEPEEVAGAGREAVELLPPAQASEHSVRVSKTPSKEGGLAMGPL